VNARAQPFSRRLHWLVGTDYHATAGCLCADQPQALQIAAVLEQPLPAASYNRMDLELKLIEQVIFEQ
jgi:hypothetical protein